MKQSTFYYLLRRGVIGGGGSSAGPTNTVAPVISGTAERGETLTSTTGTWTGTGTITYAYQWKRSGANISGATSSTYVLVAADDNAFITCNITATDDTGSRSKLSNSLGPVLAAPLNLTAPVASGTAQVGQTLSTTDGTWQGIATITFAYQWRRDAVNISGATSSTYTLVAADYTTDVDCVVTATNSLGSASADSNDIANIAGTAPSISGVPTLSGTAKVGSTLTATAASVTGVPTPTTSWQWQRSDDGSTGWANISGATSSTYTAVSADETKYLRAVQTETNVIGSDSANSASSAQVAAAFTGLLDTYSGAAAAYSLRLLDSTYTGDAIVVRRASDNTTQSIGFVNNELDTASLESFCSGTDGFVTTWYDQSGASGAADMTQSTASNQPKIVSAGSTILENGEPTIEFDYTNSQHFSASPTNWSSLVDDTNHTISMVYNLTQYNTPRSTVYDIVGDEVSSGRGNANIAMARSNQLRIAYYDRGSGSWTKTAGFTVATDYLTNDAQFLVTSIYDTTNLNSFANSTIEDNITSFPEGGIDANNFIIGAATTSGFTPMDGNMQEFIIWNIDQTSNRSGIETNINTHYSIY